MQTPNILILLFLLSSTFHSLQSQPPANDDSPLAINLSGIVSWAEGYAFVDVFKSARPWISQHPDAAWGQGPAIATDNLGWVTSLSTEQYVETVMLDGVADRPAGIYNLYYEGEGTFAFVGDVSSWTQVASGHIEVNVSAGNAGIWLRILATDPNNTGNYLRNIRLVMPGFESTYQTEPFHPTFLDTWKNFKTIRFMDWLNTNNNPTQTWAERTSPNHQSQMRSNGVALEYCIDLANTLQTDAWICIPHQADDNYITQFATMLKNDLDPNLKVYIEYSNEVWNGQFDQATYAGEQGVAQGLADNEWEGRNFYYSKRSVEIFDIFETVFGGTDQLQRVLAWQNVNVWGSAQILDYNNAYLKTDALAIAPYFSGNLGSPDTQNEVAAMSIDEILDRCEHDISVMMEGVRKQGINAADHNVSMIAYEGGPHLVGYYGAENNQTLTNLFIEANRHPRMKDLYLDYLERWKLAGGELFAVFSSMGSPSKWGSWGILENYGQEYMSVPKYAAVQQFMECNSPAWWLNPTTENSPVNGTVLIDFQGNELQASTVTTNRAPTVEANRLFLPFSTANGDHSFNCSGYAQGEFYGGLTIDYASNPLGGYLYNLSNWGAGNVFVAASHGSENIYTKLNGIFLWKKAQFLNGMSAAANVTVGKLQLHTPSMYSDGHLRFVVKNGSIYYISDYIRSGPDGTFDLELFNQSSQPTKRWRIFNPTTNNFEIPFPLVDFEAVNFDDVTEVGFVYQAERSGWSHDFQFDTFTVYSRNAEEFTVTLNQSDTQNDPTASSPIHFTAKFSEPTNNFNNSDVTIGGTALPTNVTVTEIVPNDGTTYDILLSGMSLSGSVIAQIPVNVCTNSVGHPNRAATSADHIVQFNIANPPTVTLNQSANQADPALTAPVYFTAIFSESVTGFTANDVQLSGTANPTTVIVTEIAPNDGTTFQVEVSGMNTDGTVIAAIPQGVVVNALGAANLASTSTDNVVDFYLSNPPLVTINQAANQVDPTFAENVHFTAVFSESVFGFDGSDVDLSGTANPSMAVVTEIAPNNGTIFNIEVSGMTSDGTVIADIAAGSVQNSSTGTANLASTSTDNEVQYFLQLPSMATVIDFQGANVPDEVSLNRNLQGINGNTQYLAEFSTADGSHFFNTGDSQSEFYGGAFIDYTPMADLGYSWDLRTNDNGFASNRFWAFAVAPEGQPSTLRTLFMWRKDQFLNNMDLVQVGFDEDADNSSLEVNILIASGEGFEVRFVVKQNGGYYISEFVGNTEGAIGLEGFNNSNLVGKRWTVFNPTATDFDFSGASETFAAVDFDDIEEVGFYYEGVRSGWAHALEFDAFSVNAVNRAPSEVRLNARLQAAYNPSTGMMNTDLRQNNLLPLSQPFNVAPWNYNGSESVTSSTDFPANVVDWCLVELRNANNAGQILQQKAAWLLADGSVVDIAAKEDANVKGVIFEELGSGDNYFVSIKFRNHLALLSANTISLSNAQILDFTNPNEVLQGATQLADMGNGVYACFAGDMDGNGVVNVEDFNRFVSEISQLNGYYSGDCNLDGAVTVTDYNWYLGNASVIGVEEVRY
ncbi:MAG: hypothetical protein R3E32_27685 [Chitinophagales bacterium]